MARHRDAHHHEQEAPKPLGFFGKAKLAVTSFVKSAVKSIPVSLAYSAVAFTASALIGQHFGADYDFLHTGGSTLGQLGMRMVGASIIGGTISGAVGSYKAVSDAGKAESMYAPTSGMVSRDRSSAPQPNFEVSAPMTPMGNRFDQRARI